MRGSKTGLSLMGVVRCSEFQLLLISRPFNQFHASLYDSSPNHGITNTREDVYRRVMSRGSRSSRHSTSRRGGGGGLVVVAAAAVEQQQ